MTSTYEDRTLLATDVAIKAPCRAATTANITLNGLQTVDGIVLVANDRVLVKNQTSGVNNGIYLASTGSWTRTADFDGNRDAVDGTLVLVRLGTASALALYELSCATSPANIGTTSLTFNLVSVVVGNAGSFTTLIASGQITSSLATGTAPLVIASTTMVENLNADLLEGADWENPLAIGTGTPAAGHFTTLGATGAITGSSIAATGAVSGASVAATGAITGATGSFGATPALTGVVAIPYAGGVFARNNANTGDAGLAINQTVNGVADVVSIGGGASAGVVLLSRSKAGAPTTSDIGPGQWTVWRDTTGGTTKIYYNNAGAIIASAAFA